MKLLELLLVVCVEFQGHLSVLVNILPQTLVCKFRCLNLQLHLVNLRSEGIDLLI